MACEHRLVGDDGKWRERESYPCPLCGADARLAQIEFTQTTASFVVLCPACNKGVDVQNHLAALESRLRAQQRAMSAAREVLSDAIEEIEAWRRLMRVARARVGGS